MWNIETTDAFVEWWHRLTEQEQDDITAVVELLEEKGAHFPYPYSSGIEGSKFSHMRELRIQSHSDPLRVLIPDGWLFCSSAGLKQGMKNGFIKNWSLQRTNFMRNI